MNVSKFVREHTPLCVCTLGVAVLGYLGYHAVRWIIKKCQKTQKIDQVAQKNIGHNHHTENDHLANRPPPKNPDSLPLHFSSQIPLNSLSEEKPVVQEPESPPCESLLSSRPRNNKVSDFKIQEGPIAMGQGEYIVFHRLPSGEKRSLTAETFEQVYTILLEHLPVRLAATDPQKAGQLCENRYTSLKFRLKKIDPTLEAVFIPKTLYELIFVIKCMKEDFIHQRACPFLFESPLEELDVNYFNGNQEEYMAYLKDKENRQKTGKCWHLCRFTDTDLGNDEHEGVKNVAYRLNKHITKKINPANESLTYQEISHLLEQELRFLEDIYNNRKTIQEKFTDCSRPSPLVNFAYEFPYCSIRPMCFDHNRVIKIIQDAVALECSQLAQNSLFLYRGSNGSLLESVFYREDKFGLYGSDSSPISWNEDKDTSYSVSYGCSLFAGFLYDTDASSFYLMLHRNKAYALPLPFNQLNNSIFFIPRTHTVTQLFSKGEFFHARTKAWKDFDLQKIKGVPCLDFRVHLLHHLSSNLSKEEVESQFKSYKEKAIEVAS